MKKARPICLVLGLSLVLFLLGIWWGLPDFRGWAPDEVFPSYVMSGLEQNFSHGWFDRYPPFHYYLLSLLYSPFLLLHQLHVLDFHHLPSYTILFYLGRWLSVIMGLGVVYGVYRCGREMLDRRGATFAALIAALIVPFEYYSKTVNLDVPYLFWFVASLYFFIRLLKTQRLKYYLFFTAAAVIAVCTKDQALGLYVLAPLPIVLTNWRRGRQAESKLSFVRSLLDKKYLYSLLLGTGLFVLLDNLVFNFHGFLHHVKMIEGDASQNYRIYPSTASGQAHLLGLTLRQIQGSLGWPLVVICAAGLVVALLRKKKNPVLIWLPLFAASYYLFYIARILFNTDRYNLPICIILSFFGGALIADQLSPGTRLLKTKSAVVAAVFVFSVLYSLSVDILMIKDSRYAIERWLKSNASPQAVIGEAGPMEYLPRLAGFSVVGLRRNFSGFVGNDDPDYIIFDTAYSRAFPPRSTATEFFEKITRPDSGYRLALRYQTRLPWLLVRYKNSGTNMVAVNPEIRIYRRERSPGSPDPAPAALRGGPAQAR